MGIIPSITGKVELVYEGEQEGSAIVAENLIGNAAKSLLPKFFPAMDDLKSTDENNPYNKVIEWFGKGETVYLMNDFSDEEYRKTLDNIKPLAQIVDKHHSDASKSERYFLMEWLLWALSEHAKLNREKVSRGINFSDLFSSYLKGGGMEI